MGQPGTEPSMEDILASIKRIIAEDAEPSRPQQRVRRGPVAVPDPQPVGDPELAEQPSMAPAMPFPSPLIDPPVEAMSEADGEDEPAVIDEPPPAVMRSEAVQEPADVLELTSPLPDERGPILSGAAEQASRSAFAALSQLQVRVDGGKDNTLEGLVGDLLRPMLRDWLDRELPAMVERIVEAEVKRVSGR